MSIFAKAIAIAFTAMLLLGLSRMGLAQMPGQMAARIVQAIQLSTVMIGIVLEIWAIVRLSRTSVKRVVGEAPSPSHSEAGND